MTELRIRDGFQGEKLIDIPEAKLLRALEPMPPHQLYVTQIGYFPRARYHFRDRSEGCVDNILFYCLAGCGHYMISGRRYLLRANQWTIIPATTEPVAYWADREDPWTIYWIHFTGREVELFNRAYGIAGVPVNITYNEDGLTCWERIYETLSRDQGDDGLLLSSLYLYRLLATFVSCNSHASRDDDAGRWQPGATIEFMRAHISEKLTVENMAAVSNLSLSHFSKLFRLTTGMPPIDYFIHLKMRRACQLLSDPCIEIKEIATTLGYDDYYYFSRLFRKSMNLSPKAYRKSITMLFSQP